MSMRDRIAKALTGGLTRDVEQRAFKPQFTPEQWTQELSERSAATADFNKMHDAYYTPGRAQSSMSEFAGPTRTVPITQAPAPQFTPEAWAEELAQRRRGARDFNAMNEEYYAR